MKNLKGVYLGACRAYHPKFNLDYNDIIPGYHCNLICDMLDVDLNCYDFIIASPPCNYYSRANYRRDKSDYALNTKHLLPSILNKCIRSGKLFIIENVRNYNLFKELGIIDLADKNGVFIYEYGRHTYFTNLMFNPFNCKQIKDNVTYTCNGKSVYREGGFNVHEVIDFWCSIVNS